MDLFSAAAAARASYFRLYSRLATALPTWLSPPHTPFTNSHCTTSTLTHTRAPIRLQQPNGKVNNFKCRLLSCPGFLSTFVAFGLDPFFQIHTQKWIFYYYRYNRGWMGKKCVILKQRRRANTSQEILSVKRNVQLRV